MNEDAATQEIHRKIDRERAIINAANQMRQATNNASVTSRAESQIRDARRNIQYFEQTLTDIQTRKMGGDVANLSLHDNGGPTPPQHGRGGSAGSAYRNDPGHGGGADYGDPGPGGYGMGGPPGLMPPRAPYAPPDRTPRARPNYSKLGKHNLSGLFSLPSPKTNHHHHRQT
jgi:classical protein kinase C